MHSFATPLVLAALAATSLPAQTVVQSWSAGGAFAGGVMYDYVSDSVWVIDSGTQRIDRYDRNGGLTGSVLASAVGAPPVPIGGFVHPVTGNLWIADEAEAVYEMTQQGVLTGVQWSTLPTLTDVSALTYDPNSDTVYVSNDSGRLVAEFDLQGNPIRSFGVAAAGSDDADGLAYDPISGTFFLGEDTLDRIIQVDRSGFFIASWQLGSIPISPEGLDIDARTGAMFVVGGAQRSVFEVGGIVAPCPPGSMVTAYGTGCADSGGVLPIARGSGCPMVGRPLSFGAEFSATINTGFGIVVVGSETASVPLGGFGAPGCTALTAPFPPVIFASLPIANGRTGFTVRSWPLPPGVGATVQFGIFPDPGAASGGGLPISLTNGVAVQG